MVRIDQFTALRGRVALFNLGPNLAAMLCQPSFLIMEQGNGALDEFVVGLVWPALNVCLIISSNLHEPQFTSR